MIALAREEIDRLPRGRTGRPIRPPGVGRRGPIRRKPGKLEKDQFLTLVGAGMGCHLACEKLGISYKTFRNTYESEREFRLEVEWARRAADERLEAVAYATAVGGDGGRVNVEVLLTMLGRIDQRRRLAWGRREKAKYRALIWRLCRLVNEGHE